MLSSRTVIYIIVGIVLAVLTGVILYLIFRSKSPGSHCPPPPPPSPPKPQLNTERLANNEYYSYALTVLKGGVIPSMSCVKCGPDGTANVNGQIFSTIGNPQLDNGSPLYQIDYGPWKGQTYVDFDASSGLMCGNSWGQPSKQAEIIYNILSLSAPNPVIEDEGIYKAFVSETYYDNGNVPTYSSWQGSCILQPPKCYGNNDMWSHGMIYVGGFMGLSYGSGSNNISWGHFGETYGYTSLSQFFSGKVSGFGGILENADVVFVAAQNSDTNGQTACGNAITSLIAQLSGDINEQTLNQAIIKAITWAYCNSQGCAEPKVNYLSYPGTTMTIGYFFIDKNGLSHRGSQTLSVIDGSLQVPTTYTFTNSQCQVEYLGADGGREPAYYYGSGTKPITVSLTVNALSKAWRRNNPLGSPKQFMQWYRGTGLVNGIYSCYGALTMGGILNMTNQSYYKETVQKYTDNRDPTNIGSPTFTNSTKIIQDWYGEIYTNNGCSWKGLSQDLQKCPSNMCYELPDTAIGCSCATNKDLNDIFMNKLTPVSMNNMRGGVPDSDTLGVPATGLVPSTGSLQLDYIDQVIGRTNPIGPINYLRELIGFNWVPGWEVTNSPTTPGFFNSFNPPAQYSSSGFTLLGTILWVLDPNGPKSRDKAVNWSKIDINGSFLPSALKSNNNYAGTSGNNGTRYFVSVGNQPQKGVLSGCGCNVSNKFRQDCIGPSGADRETCLQAGCCYQPNMVVVNGQPTPWCFKKI